MTTQMHSVIAAQVDSKTITRSSFKQYEKEQAEIATLSNDLNSSFGALFHATATILRHAFFLAEFKKTHSKREYRKLLSEHGFVDEEKKYLKIAAAFQKFSPQDLAQIEPRTIYQLAENSKKYQPVIDQLLDLAEVSQKAVRELVRKQRQPREIKPEKPSIWRRTKNGGRYCQIPPIHEENERTGITLQKMMDTEGTSAQKIVAEAIALRQAYKEGRLLLVQEIAN
ncbi:hypothetical protein QUB80_34240 [Chlorogloeopsis sp. ULAP01]|uniref:hypothetical protein n=1 Tax=Chlorogloeopsis sp. ULAP01 TaxID=3056483 RepID=UPI0025AB2190|nr:hypothetical protein [Chlorogloeopsis sp. ULAP01]MDM9385716.1 hypothetical protein [Chlorogloeopsis sp. ULAP01]